MHCLQLWEEASAEFSSEKKSFRILLYRLMALCITTLSQIFGIHYEFTYAVTASVAAVCVYTWRNFIFLLQGAFRNAGFSYETACAKRTEREYFWRGLRSSGSICFSWKSTLRNLFRYKKRLLWRFSGLREVWLLLVGFGIQDSIMDIALRRYSKLQHYDGTIISDEVKRGKRTGRAGKIPSGRWKDFTVYRCTVYKDGDSGRKIQFKCLCICTGKSGEL